MVGLSPVLRCLLSVEDGISRGDATRSAILAWLEEENRKNGGKRSSAGDERRFQCDVLDFLRQSESLDLDSSSIALRSTTIYRQSLFTIFESGLKGNSILPRLKELRAEIEMQLELDMKAHVESLPLKMLLPLLLAMFPAFLILLLGPITQSFMEALK